MIILFVLAGENGRVCLWKSGRKKERELLRLTMKLRPSPLREPATAEHVQRTLSVVQVVSLGYPTRYFLPPHPARYDLTFPQSPHRSTYLHHSPLSVWSVPLSACPLHLPRQSTQLDLGSGSDSGLRVVPVVARFLV